MVEEEFTFLALRYFHIKNKYCFIALIKYLVKFIKTILVLLLLVKITLPKRIQTAQKKQLAS